MAGDPREPTAPESERSFEDLLARLEEIAARLEGDELELSESLALYEEGVGLLRLAGDVLGRAEERVRELRPEGEGFRIDSRGEEP